MSLTISGDVRDLASPTLPVYQIHLGGDSRVMNLVTEVGALTAEVRNLRDRIEVYEHGPSYLPKHAEPGSQREVVTLHGAALPCLYVPHDENQPAYVTHVAVNGAWVPSCEFGDQQEDRWHEELRTVLGEPARIGGIQFSDLMDGGQ